MFNKTPLDKDISNLKGEKRKLEKRINYLQRMEKKLFRGWIEIEQSISEEIKIHEYKEKISELKEQIIELDFQRKKGEIHIR